MVSSGLAIYDTMQYIRPDVSTLCIGQAASMGSLLLAAGAHGKRFCLPHARIMIHQPSGGFRGQASDIEIHAREILSLRARLNEIYARHTGQDLSVIEANMERDTFLSGEQAKEFGLVDDVVSQRTSGRRPTEPRRRQPGAAILRGFYRIVTLAAACSLTRADRGAAGGGGRGFRWLFGWRTPVNMPVCSLVGTRCR